VLPAIGSAGLAIDDVADRLVAALGADLADVRV